MAGMTAPSLSTVFGAPNQTLAPGSVQFLPPAVPSTMPGSQMLVSAVGSPTSLAPEPQTFIRTQLAPEPQTFIPQAGAICVCGNTFAPDAIFCRMCGTRRPEAYAGQRSAGSRAASAASSFALAPQQAYRPPEVVFTAPPATNSFMLRAGAGSMQMVTSSHGPVPSTSSRMLVSQVAPPQVSLAPPLMVPVPRQAPTRPQIMQPTSISPVPMAVTLSQAQYVDVPSLPGEVIKIERPVYVDVDPNDPRAALALLPGGQTRGRNRMQEPKVKGFPYHDPGFGCHFRNVTMDDKFDEELQLRQPDQEAPLANLMRVAKAEAAEREEQKHNRRKFEHMEHEALHALHLDMLQDGYDEVDAPLPFRAMGKRTHHEAYVNIDPEPEYQGLAYWLA